jgi:hypothetical protein
VATGKDSVLQEVSVMIDGPRSSLLRESAELLHTRRPPTRREGCLFEMLAYRWSNFRDKLVKDKKPA